MTYSGWASPAIIVAVTVAFVLSALQARINARHGSDHAVHSFLIRAIRQGGFRMFVRIPRLINASYVGALPLYLHWIFAHFPLSVMRRAEKLLNPTASAVHVVVVGAIAAVAAGRSGLPDSYIAAVALSFALTPQFYHALSARNFGLSARSLGLVFLTGVFFAVWSATANPSDQMTWLLLLGSCYLTWAFSTFGAQALVLCSVALTVITGEPYALLGAAGGLAVFVVVHPRYSIGYLRHTARFIRAYAHELAPVYVLERRYSVWRDLVWDIWRRLAVSPRAGFRYAYENSALIVLVLNPLVPFAAAGRIFGDSTELNGLPLFACDVALAGLLAAVATSFRPTRFLGEPERYVEAVAPWGAIGATAIVYNAGWGTLAPWIAATFAVAVLVQVMFSRILAQYLTTKTTDLPGAEAAIAGADLGSIRCCSNNEQFTKLLLHNDWDFAYCIAAGSGYCGMTLGEAFDPFPMLRPDALERVIEQGRITACVLDRSQFETPFSRKPKGMTDARVIFETDTLRVFAFDWQDDACSSSAVASLPHAATA